MVGVGDRFLQDFVKAQHFLGAVVEQILLIFISGQAQGLRRLFLARLAAQAAGQRAQGVALAVAVLAHGARTPVLAPQLVEDGAAHAQRRIARKAGIGLAVAAQRFEQSHQADLFHVLAPERARHLAAELARDALDQRRIGQQVAPLVLGAHAGGLRLAIVGAGAGGNVEVIGHIGHVVTRDGVTR